MKDSSSVEGGEITRVHRWIPSYAGRHDTQNMTLGLPCRSVWLMVGYTRGRREKGREGGGGGREGK